MKLVALVSCYREGALFESTVRSALAACDEVIIFEGPIGDAPPTGEPTDLRKWAENQAVLPYYPGRQYKSDAHKRNTGLREAKQRKAAWALWLDGDEVLIWPSYLRDHVGRAEHVTSVGGFPLRIVELDGSVAYSYGRVFKPHNIRKYLIGVSQAELHTGMVVGLPNEKICSAGGLPAAPEGGWAGKSPDEIETWMAKHRPPVGGEPHILHRAVLRDPNRGVQRQHLAEEEAYNQQWEAIHGQPDA